MTSIFQPSVHHPRGITAEGRAEFASLLARLAIGFVHLPPHEVDAALGRALGEVGGIIGADRASLWRTTPDRQHLEVGLEWQAPGASALPPDCRTVTLEAAQKVDSGGHWFTGDGARHAVSVPLRVADRLIGVARFEGLAGHGGWPVDIDAMLAPFGELCTSAIAAQRAIAGLEASELRHRSVLDEVGDVIVRIGPDGALSYVNRAWYELTGNPRCRPPGSPRSSSIRADGGSSPPVTAPGRSTGSPRRPASA